MLAVPELEGNAPCPALDWLEASWREPLAFFRALFDEHAARSAYPPRSRFGEAYDFYYDAVQRQVDTNGGEQAAYRGCGEDGALATVTFAELHALCTARANEWTARGFEAGQVVCLVLPVGLELLVSLLAALRLGLVVSYVPPSGERFVATRLEALGPDHVIRGPLTPTRSPRREGETAPTATSHAYPASATVGFFFAPQGPAPSVPRPLSAGDLYLRALRDGRLAYSLAPGDALAAPGAHALSHHPALLLATLLSGAAYVHLSLEDIARDPGLLAAAGPLRTVGVSRELRDLLLRAAGSGTGTGTDLALGKVWKHWFKDPAESLDLEAWQDFAKELGLEAVPASNVLAEAASGGVLFFSARRRRNVSLSVLPAPGAPWGLADVGGSGKPASGDVGLFAPVAAGSEASPHPGPVPAGEREKKGPPRPLLLSRRRGEWFFLGLSAPSRFGRAYLREEVLACVATIPEVVEASVVTGPAPATSGTTARFVLLLFTPPRPDPVPDGRGGLPDLAGEVRSLVERDLGAEHLPDGVEAYPFYARAAADGKGGGVDHAWCQAQYVGSGLYRKSQSRLHAMLTRVRALAAMEWSASTSTSTSTNRS